MTFIRLSLVWSIAAVVCGMTLNCEGTSNGNDSKSTGGHGGESTSGGATNSGGENGTDAATCVPTGRACSDNTECCGNTNDVLGPVCRNLKCIIAEPGG